MALSSSQNNNSAHRLNPLPSPITDASPRSVGVVRPTLPQKAVTSASIEDAYVAFILYCNPAVPLETDTSALREAFRTPPKSEGKSFSTFNLFELIKKLNEKEIKTWAELALRLGVEPPDHDKGQSSQKIQQYAVRLKRWMHSMHVNAFFDYLLDNPHNYWTHIPSDPNPVCEDGRDGVAAEDDMALRALLPHIRPRRGRKRPEDDTFSKSPSQRPRLDSPTFNGEARVSSRPDSLDPWTAHPDGRHAFVFPPVDPRSSILPESSSAFPWHNDTSREPMSAYPMSAMTPSTRGGFWLDPSEPRSAISPSKNKPYRRHGAKVVSSAWRSSAISAGGKARGRPPTSRVTDSPLSSFPEERKTPQAVSLEQKTPQSTTAPVPMFPPDSIPRSSEPAPAQNARPPRPGRLSLQVPERAGGPVRLATPPPPVVMVNGKSTMNENAVNGTNGSTEPPAEAPFTVLDRTSAMFTNGVSSDNSGSVTPSDFNGSDRTNCDEIEAIFISDLLTCDWYDQDGRLGPSASIEEVTALTKTCIESISKQALTKQAFLINLSALAGVSYMMKAGSNHVQRCEVGPDYTKYLCSWSLQFGAVNGSFTLSEMVPHSRWKKEFQKQDELSMGVRVPTEGEAATEYWRGRYADLVRVKHRKHEDACREKGRQLEKQKQTFEG
ncbi:ARS binding protein 2-domain-containing protein [Xylariaceae sp. FL0662B]|nr:ARS binding protein 2-domain-containing protein [Xylariaceae sp. FL0662B]